MQCNALKRAHLISCIYILKAQPLNPIAVLHWFLPPNTHTHTLTKPFDCTRFASISCSLLTLRFFSCVFLWFPSESWCSSFKHNTFYIQDVLCSYFLVVFSKKRRKNTANMQKLNNLFLSTWVQWLCSLMYLLGNNTVYPCLEES